MADVTRLENIQYERQDSVGVWHVTDFTAAFESDELAAGEDHYRDVASDPEGRATVVVIENALQLGSQIRDSLSHIAEEWSKLAGEVDVDRLAYVAEGTMGTAVTSKLDVDVAVESFEDLDPAVEWASEA